MTKDDYLRQQGIKDDNAIKNLGIFAIVVALLLLVAGLICLIRLCCGKFKCCRKIGNLLQKKVFYSGPIRYIIVGYLKLMN